jgi:hypothetical protein
MRLGFLYRTTTCVFSGRLSKKHFSEPPWMSVKRPTAPPHDSASSSSTLDARSMAAAGRKSAFRFR